MTSLVTPMAPGVPTARRCTGFTLIELSIVLFIITLLLAGSLTPLSQQLAERQSGQTRQLLETARTALIGYALSHRDADGRPYLPCPDLRQPMAGATANDGREDRRPDGGCMADVGNSPWITLGVPESDAWGNRLTYAVSPAFATASSGLSAWPEPATTVQVCLDQGCAGHTQTAAVILSHGRNGLGASNQSGRSNLPASGADEMENSDADARFVLRPPSATDRPGGEFDDMGLALSGPWLLGRLCGPESGC